MKKYVIFILSGLFFLSAGCDRANETSNYEELLLKVASSDVVFTSAGGQGSIVVDHPRPVKATSDMPWCTVSVSGQTISVNVPDYYELPSRHALITISEGSQKNYVTVSQFGFPFSLASRNETISAAGGEIQIDYDCEMQPTLTPSAGWITGTVNHTLRQITLNVAQYGNTTIDRQATVVVDVGPKSETITVVQSKFVPSFNDFLGTYIMSYSLSYSDPTPTRELTVTIEPGTAANTYYLKGILAPADEEIGHIIANYSPTNGFELLGQKIYITPGTPDRDFWFLPWSIGNSTSRSTTYGLKGTNIEVDAAGKLSFSMVDNGLWASVGIGFLTRKYDFNTADNSANVNHQGGDYRIAYPTFMQQ